MSSIAVITENSAEEELNTLFDLCVTDGILKKYDLVLVDRKAQGQGTSYLVSFVIQVANSFPYEVIKRVVKFCRDNECSFNFEGTHREWREVKFEMISISVEVTIEQ